MEKNGKTTVLNVQRRSEMKYYRTYDKDEITATDYSEHENYNRDIQEETYKTANKIQEYKYELKKRTNIIDYQRSRL